MKIIKGVINNKTKLTMSILLKTGVSLITKRDDKFQNGEKVFVTYNFEENRIRNIWTEKDMTNFGETMSPMPKNEEVGDPGIDIFEDLDLTNT